MREFFLSSLLCLFFTLSLTAQSDDLMLFNQKGQQKQKNAMMVLGGWAVSNIAIGAALRGQHQGVERSFHDMNIGWNLVNLGIATLGYIGASKADPAAMGLFESVQKHHGFQKTLLFNAGLDVGYMLGGLYLMERSKNAPKNPDRLKGFGRSIILQGGFLFVFDLVNYFIFAGDSAELKPLIGMDMMGGQQFGLAVRF
jgi:hypothetical protein